MTYRQPYLTFVVKGPEQTAREQMFARGIIAHTLAEVMGNTVFKSSMDYYNEVMLWFCEVPPLTQGYGYPDGTCLIYSTHETEVQS